ncbi:ATP synthase F1 subunit delta [Alphaproteobacteria bacterium]|nr:ATP synthase F1 subunit delta [Alphaproteobacteria bacterium]
MEEKIQFSTEVSRRYAKALFDIAKGKFLEQNMFQEVNSILEIINSDKKFKKLFESPVLSSKDQKTMIEAVFSVKDKKRIIVSEEMFKFLKVIGSNRRLKILTSVLYSFLSLVKSINKEVNVKVTSAVPLNEKILLQIKSIFLNRTKKQINIVSYVDKSIIGGIILQIGSNLIDASVKSKILKINNVIKGAN